MPFLNEILSAISYVSFHGNSDVLVNEVTQLSGANVKDDTISWCSNANMESLKEIKAGTVICSVEAIKYAQNPLVNWIIVEKPRYSFLQVIKNFFAIEKKGVGISERAIIHPSAVIGKDCYIGHNVVIEENCMIGDFCSIGHQTTILSGTVIKNNVAIGCNCTIGGVGFGYERNNDDNNELIPHIGNVVIEDDVEIGNNTCIDKAVLGSTYIGKHVKIDNLVHIAHGVQIGQNSFIIANAMLGGSVKIGENVWVAPSSSVINKVDIGKSALIGLGAVVTKPVCQGAVVVGNPAKELQKKTI